MKTIVANILLAHGSSDPKWQTPFDDMTNAIKQHDKNTRNHSEEAAVVELAYMELCQPSLEETCSQLAQKGIELINIYPVFFAAGRHLRIDVPKQLAAIEEELGIRTELHPPIGQEKAVQEAITQVILQRL